MLDSNQVNAQLRPAFAALKQEMHDFHAPASVEANLLAAFKKQRPPQAWWRKWFAEPWQWSGVLVMSLLVTLIMLNKPMLPDTEANVLVQDDHLYEDIPFIALESGENILKQDSMRIVRADVLHTMLASLGVPVNPQNAGETSRAEMLVGENDEYLAVRFIPGE
ncbi:hypothetical protein [Undibacterium sp.]|uniref:hypothetical protein n=1 Tax=Undibacterium sp. TaxID=1914977 RepID=UPI003751054F